MTTDTNDGAKAMNEDHHPVGRPSGESGQVAMPSDREVKALAEALFDYEPRNSAKRYSEASIDVQMRYLDKAAWSLKQARKALSGEKS